MEQGQICQAERVVYFLQIPWAAFQLVLDYAPPPGVGPGVAHCTGNALQLGKFLDGVAKRELKRVERNCVLAFQVTIAIAKAADECSVGPACRLSAALPARC